MSSKGKIYVCCHFDAFVADCSGVKALAVGAENHNFKGDILLDNTAENISQLNASYCELSGLYWLWKNTKSDYYGLCHYRRYFDFRGGSKPYKLGHLPTEKVLKKLNYDAVPTIMKECDIIVPVAEDFGVSVYEHYATAPHHNKDDLDIIKSLIEELYPEYTEAMTDYFNGNKNYTGNMVVLNAKHMDIYCKWLFEILLKFDAISDKTAYTKQAMRVNGYLGERLLGVFITKLRQDKVAVIKEYPKVHFLGYTKAIKNILTRLQYFLLPPNSKRRIFVRKFFKSHISK